MSTEISAPDFLGTLKLYKKPELITLYITRVAGSWIPVYQLVQLCLNRKLKESLIGPREHAKASFSGSTAVVDIYWN